LKKKKKRKEKKEKSKKELQTDNGDIVSDPSEALT
jgi:hypothetical protein